MCEPFLVYINGKRSSAGTMELWGDDKLVAAAHDLCEQGNVTSVCGTARSCAAAWPRLTKLAILTVVSIHYCTCKYFSNFQ